MVFSAGNVLTASGLNDATLSAIATYTPSIAGGGTATFTTNTGWYYKIGTSHLVFVSVYFVVNAAGSGASNVTVTTPSNPDRTTRQSIVGVRETSGSSRAAGAMVAFTGGSGAIWDRLIFGTGSGGITGVDLAAGSLHNFTGFYREA
jgi:hypothetical protein